MNANLPNLHPPVQRQAHESAGIQQLRPLMPKWKFWPLKHTCSKWQQEEPAKLEKRMAWLRKRGLDGE